MTRCIVIGSKVRATSTAHLLSTSNVPSRAIVQDSNHTKIIADCGKENELEVVAVFCNDFSRNALVFLRGLHGSLNSRVRIHALKDGNGQTEPTSRSLYDLGVGEVFCFSKISPFSAATSIKKRWFSSERQSLQVAQEEKIPVPALQKPAFEKLLGTIERNGVMPLKPLLTSIVGKHGSIIELDPRRVKPLPDNPRWVTNPGFTSESLRELGESIKLVGQAEPGVVCPIAGDPDYDAQLIDGERRLRSCKLAGVMFKTGVREDVTVKMLPALWVLSVIRNNGKEPPTVRELIQIVTRLRSDEFGFTITQVSQAIGKGIGTVQRLFILGKLHPQVQAMLDDAPKESDGSGGSGKKDEVRRTRTLTSQLALLLADFPLGEQLAKAEAIVSKNMGFKQARRYVLGERREAGLRVAGGKGGNQKRWFEALITLTAENVESYGVYLDMTDKEIVAMTANCSIADREKLAAGLEFLAVSLNNIADKVRRRG